MTKTLIIKTDINIEKRYSIYEGDAPQTLQYPFHLVQMCTIIRIYGCIQVFPRVGLRFTEIPPRFPKFLQVNSGLSWRSIDAEDLNI